MESRWVLIFSLTFWWFTAWPAAGVGNQFTLAIRYWYHNTAVHNALAAMKADPEIVDSLSCESARLEIRMVLIEVFKCEL